MKQYDTLKTALAVIFCLLSASLAFAQPTGASISNPIDIYTLNSTYTDTRNNSPANGYLNNMGQPSDDIYYKFTLTAATGVNISHCGSGFDTYVYVLNSSGSIIASNDDNATCPGYYQAFITAELAAGTYYVVSEGYGSQYGAITTQISKITPIGASMANPIDIGILAAPFSDTKNNSVSNGYGNDIGNSSDDIYYKFTLSTSAEVTMSHCPSGFDTYMYLLDANGAILATNDDNGVICQSVVQASLKVQLAAGTYYLVSEGWSGNFGDITTEIGIPNASFTAEADNIFQHLDKSRIPTGILYDRIVPLSNIHQFNAVMPDTSSNKHFFQAYSEVYGSAYDQSSWLSPDDLKNVTLGKFLKPVREVPIGLAKYQFNTIDPDAIENGQIAVVDSVLYDASTTSNPYITRNAIIASPLIDSISTDDNTVIFNFSEDLTLNRSTIPMTSMTVDFGNGGAAQAISLNTDYSVSITYPSPGYKTLTFTIGSSDGSTTVTKALVRISLRPSRGGGCNPVGSITAITSDLTFQGYDESFSSPGKGEYKIFYATNGACDQVLRKPVIVLDGFDPGDNRSIDVLYDSYLNDAVRGTFASDMRALGYDIVVLNFPTYQTGSVTFNGFPRAIQVPVNRDGGADYIERNARVLIKLITMINAQKQGNEKLTIIGPSMGGLISRYALKYMEQHSMPHQTKLWVSFDSPHQGANIAIGDQYFLDFYASMSDGAKTNRDEKIMSTAAKQMLVHHYSADSYGAAGAPDFRDRFATELDNMGFPSGDPGQPFRKIALVDGSLGGVQVNSPGQKGFTFDVRHTVAINLFLFKWKIRLKTFTIASAHMYFTPAYGTQESNVLEANKPLWNRTIKEAYTPSNTTGYDTAPGGTFRTQQTLADQGTVGIGFADSHTIAGQGLNILTLGFFNASAKFYSVVPAHSFISTKSALGFTGGNQDLAENVSNRNLVCTGETPFDSYYGDFSTNREHVELWPSAVAWITEEIKGNPQPPPVLTASLPAVNSNVYISGSYKLSATATQLSGTNPADYNWYHYRWGTKTFIGNGLSIIYDIPHCNTEYEYSVEVSTPCQLYTNTFYAFNGQMPGCMMMMRSSGQSYRFFPNPASNDLTVKAVDDDPNSSPATLTSKAAKKDFNVALFNSQGKRLRVNQSDGKRSISFDTQNIPNGTYFLHITEGKEVLKSQIIIQHE